MRRWRSVFLAVILLASFSAALAAPPERVRAHVPHAPILVEGNGDFTSPGAGFGCECVTGGSGTTADPYVVGGWEVDASSSHGVDVRNTTVPFVVRDVLAHGPSPMYHAGVAFFNLTDGAVENATLASNGFGVVVESSSRVTVAGNAIVSNTAYGLHLRSSTDVTVRGNRFASDGVVIDGDALAHFNSHAIADDNLVNGRPLLYFRDRKGVEVDGVPVGQFLVANCTDVSLTRVRITDTDSAVHVAYASNVTVRNVEVSGSRRHGIHVERSSDVTVADSNISSNGGFGIRFHQSTGLVATGNEVSHNGGGIMPLRSSRITVTGNRVFWNGLGMLPERVTDAVISGNEVSRSIQDAIQPIWSSNVTIADNDVHDNNADGIDFWASDGLFITGNRVYRNVGVGVEIVECVNVSIADNGLFWNHVRGVYIFRPAANVTIARNELSGNGVGVEIDALAAGVRVFHNDFDGNFVQAVDGGGFQNDWDDGYPSGGNWWSDYRGPDNCSGPFQNVCPDPDGIGDTPYDIDANSRDRYPLVAPPVDTTPPIPPTVVAATLTGASWADLSITWVSSPDENTRGGTKSYRVLRAIGDASGPYVEIASVAAGSPSYTFVCPGCGHVPGDTTAHFYKVRAVDASNHTADSNLAARYAKSLAAGMNLLTVPLSQADDSLPTVLQTVWSSVVSVRTYEAANASDPWKAYVTAKGHGEITTLPFGTAFWVNVTAAGQYTVAGLLVDRPTVFLHTGWNLVAYASLANETVAASLAGLPVTRVEAFAAIPDPYRLRVAAADEPLVWGETYWVFATAEGVWTQG